MEQKQRTTRRQWIKANKPPLALALFCMLWELVDAGFGIGLVVKVYFTFVCLSLIYTWLLSWIKKRPGQKPSTIELVLVLPVFVVMLIATVPPFSYVRPWLLTVLLALGGYMLWALGIGYLIQETRMKRICTACTTAVVVDNVKEQMRHRPGEIPPPTYFPVLVYTVEGQRIERKYDHGQPRPMELDRRIEIRYNPTQPTEICFQKQGVNKALTMGVPFMLLMGIGTLVAAVLTVRMNWGF